MAQKTPNERGFKVLSDDNECCRNFTIYWIDYPLFALFSFLFFIVFLQFFSRYVLNDSIAWTEEVARYLLILLSFSGAIRCQITGAHIALEFVDKYYGKYTHWVHIFVLLVIAIMFAVIVYSAWELIEKTAFQRMVSLPFPKYYLYACVMALIAGNFLVVSIQLSQQLKQQWD